MLYRLFVNANKDGADITALVTCLKQVGEIEVRNESDRKKNIEGIETMHYGASTLKLHCFMLLLNFIYKVNRIYTAEEIPALEAELNHQFGVLTEKMKLLRKKLARKASDDLLNIMEQLRSIKATVNENIKRIQTKGNDPRAAQMYKQLIARFTKNQGIIENSLIDETIIDKAALDIIPPKRSLFRLGLDYTLSFLTSIGTGTAGLSFGMTYLLSWGIPLLGVVISIVGLALCAGGGLAYYFKKADDVRKQQFSDKHKTTMQEARILETNLIVKNSQYKMQSKEDELDLLNSQLSEQSNKNKEQLIAISIAHAKEIEQLNRGFESRLLRHEKTISSQQSALKVHAEALSGLNATFSVLEKYIQFKDMSTNSEEAKNEPDNALEDELSPGFTSLEGMADTVEKDTQTDPILLTAHKLVKRSQNLSTKLIRKVSLSQPGAQFFQSEPRGLDSPDKNIAKRLEFMASPAGQTLESTFQNTPGQTNAIA